MAKQLQDLRVGDEVTYERRRIGLAAGRMVGALKITRVTSKRIYTREECFFDRVTGQGRSAYNHATIRVPTAADKRQWKEE